ncbi:MAG: TIM barrel protein [Pseudomonadota bacterium]
MRLSISNFAWNPELDEAVAACLNSFGVSAIDIAPGKYFSDLEKITTGDINKIAEWWHQKNIDIVGMQGLLFGAPGLNIFGDKKSQDALIKRLESICRIGRILRATRLVFGSAKNRDRSGLSDSEAFDIAVPFFKRLGDVAGKYDVVVCLEPNPPLYGANFMTTFTETANIVKAVDCDTIKMQLDIGACAINQEDINDHLAQNSHLIGHIHASEPQLLPLGSGGVDHSVSGAAIHRYLPHHIVTIEMLTANYKNPLAIIGSAVEHALKYYMIED